MLMRSVADFRPRINRKSKFQQVIEMLEYSMAKKMLSLRVLLVRSVVDLSLVGGRKNEKEEPSNPGKQEDKNKS